MEARCNYFVDKDPHDPTRVFNYIVRLYDAKKKELKTTNKRL